MLSKFLIKKCPECGEKLTNAQKQKETMLFIVEELLFFGGIGLLAFGRGNYELIGATFIAVSIIIIFLFGYLTQTEYICPKCKYTTLNNEK